jgi:hypothetical protein
MNVHEEAIIEAFILPERRDRYRMLLRNPRRRKKALDTLNHNPSIDPRFATPIGSHEDVARILRAHGAPPRCYVLSAIPELDGCEMSLEEALDGKTRGYRGTIIGCIPGRLAVYLGEGREIQLLLRRPGVA